jgi:L-ascorbate metabolism protein UlaG (beta-lactamase superfamily)
MISSSATRPRRKRWRRIGAVLGLFFAGVLAVLLRSTEWMASFGGRLTGMRLERARRSPEFASGTFHNRDKGTLPRMSLREMARRQFFGTEQREPLGPIPVVRRTARDYATPPASGLRATWIGWATVLVEIDGERVLTDPIWSERCSPSTLVGPKRFHPPPIALDELPKIDVVVISHDHYDHLDMTTIKALAARGAQFAVPLGIGAHLQRWGVPLERIHELDWNESIDIAGLTLTATPARHYSGRNPLHANETLWASWVIRGPKHRVFFSGDSGYAESFREIGAAFGPFDLTLIKIGASDPSWATIHMTPEEAVRTHRDVGGRVMIPVHWATFNMAFHSWGDPADRAVAAAKKAGITLVVPRPGEFVEPEAPRPAQVVWWNLGGG